jgi:hypothetical protein
MAITMDSETATPATRSATTPAASTRSADDRIAQLSAVSARRVLDPDVVVPGGPGDGQVVPDELLSIAGLDVLATLTPEQKAKLSREEIAAVAQEGVRFESVLTAGFSMRIANDFNLGDPRVTYILHELGEETRHSRLFLRMVDKLAPTADNPFAKGVPNRVRRLIISFAIRRPTLLFVLVLAGEEIPDLLQKRLAEHPDCDAFVREVSKYHRQEEARHLAFARTVLPEEWAKASWLDKALVRYVAPWMVQGMFETLVHPGVYESVGLPGWRTWRAMLKSAPRVDLRHQATRPILDVLVEGGCFAANRIPRPWRRLTGVTGTAPSAAAAG